MKRITGISAVMIVKNEETFLGDCLATLKAFPEVVVYLNGCTDGSETVASQYPNVRVVHGEFLGFGPTRNKAAEYATNDWVFTIDADDRMSQECSDALANLDIHALKSNDAITVRRAQIFSGKKLRPSIWSKNFSVRVYNRNAYQSINNVHERLTPINQGHWGDLIMVPGEIVHLLPGLEELLKKADGYAILSACSGKRRLSKPLAAIVASWRFMATLIFKMSFTYGWAGVQMAYWEYYRTYVKYTLKPPKSTEEETTRN